MQRSQRIAEEPLEEHIGRVLGSVGPSMILTATSESIAFFLGMSVFCYESIRIFNLYLICYSYSSRMNLLCTGSMTSMPAVQMFSVYAGMAVVFNTLLQFTVFLGLFTLDSRRQTVRILTL